MIPPGWDYALPTQFICCDCGVAAMSVAPDGGKLPIRCGPCQWLHETPDVQTREVIKGLVHRRRMD